MNSNEEPAGLAPEVPVGQDVISSLVALPPKALVTEAGLAKAFGVTTRTVRRMVARGELPPPIRLTGKSTWIAERILAHLDARAECAAREADREARRIRAIEIAAAQAVKSSSGVQERLPDSKKA
ncbi:MAG: hypothetical protein L6R28_20190 [Planctomycetes bacterium]|nr:hypothetical protein [Planctomycetota bacterium]